ncbi:MAG: TonB-dependent receptor [Chitinophagales bacterium]
MRYILLPFLLLVGFTQYALAQGPPGAPGYNQGAPTSGGITGVVLSNEDDSFIEYANVIVKDSSNNMINGVITDTEGKFMVKNIPFGQPVNLEISFIGFTTINKTITLSKENPFHQTGIIKMMSDTELLKEVQIKGEQVVVQTSLDKKTYNVDKSAITKSKSASDVLNELPSVSVDADGNISLRGNANVRILVDGESSLAASGNIELILQQIPAESIEKIDVVTNPSAKYDPDGTSGIINIILKKEKQRGINGTISAGYGTWDKYNAATFINYKKNKFGLTANYNFRYTDSYRNGFLKRTTNSEGVESVLDQTSKSDNDNMSHFGRLGLTYNPNKKNTLSFSVLTNMFQFNRDAILSTNIFNGMDSTAYDSNRESLFNGTGVFSSGSIYHTVKFKEESAEVKYGANYSVFRGNFDGGFREDSIVIGNSFFLTAQETEVDAISHSLEIPVDFTFPINDDITEEFGLNSSFNWREADFTSRSKFFENDDFSLDEALLNVFNYKEQNHAVYFNHIHKINRFSYQVGLRLEEVFINANVESLSEGTQTFKRDYFGWYPSVFLRQSFGKDEKSLHELQVSYSRRINRPSFRIVNPFRDYTDPLNPREGNPFLQPEFINSFELGYNKVFDKVTLNSSLFYKLTTDLFTRISTLIEEDIVLTSYDNIGKSHEFGWEIVSKFKVLKWWDLEMDFNISKNYIRGETLNFSLNNENISYGGKATTTMRYKGFEAQIIGRYRGPQITSQGEQNGFGTLDISLKQDILKKKGSITFSANDLTNSVERTGNTIGENFTSEFRNKRETRIFWLTFSYGFGKMGAMFNKRANRRNGGDDDDGGGEEGVF